MNLLCTKFQLSNPTDSEKSLWTDGWTDTKWRLYSYTPATKKEEHKWQFLVVRFPNWYKMVKYIITLLTKVCIKVNWKALSSSRCFRMIAFNFFASSPLNSNTSPHCESFRGDSLLEVFFFEKTPANFAFFRIGTYFSNSFLKACNKTSGMRTAEE